MSRTTILLSLAVSASLLGACADMTAPSRSGSDDRIQIDQRGKKDDPQPHPTVISTSRGSEVRGKADASREAQPGDDKGKHDAQPADDKGMREAQPADDKGRKRDGKDDPANHG